MPIVEFYSLLPIYISILWLAVCCKIQQHIFLFSFSVCNYFCSNSATNIMFSTDIYIQIQQHIFMFSNIQQHIFMFSTDIYIYSNSATYLYSQGKNMYSASAMNIFIQQKYIHSVIFKFPDIPFLYVHQNVPSYPTPT